MISKLLSFVIFNVNVLSMTNDIVIVIINRQLTRGGVTGDIQFSL